MCALGASWLTRALSWGDAELLPVLGEPPLPLARRCRSPERGLGLTPGPRSAPALGHRTFSDALCHGKKGEALGRLLRSPERYHPGNERGAAVVRGCFPWRRGELQIPESTGILSARNFYSPRPAAASANRLLHAAGRRPSPRRGPRGSRFQGLCTGPRAASSRRRLLQPMPVQTSSPCHVPGVRGSRERSTSSLPS